MTIIRTLTKNQKETEEAGKSLSKKLKPGDVVALYGELGAGKTALVRGALRGLGFSGEVTSPTYAIVSEYRTDIGRAAHFDMYRIDDEERLYTTGYYDYIGDAVLFIEWSERIPWALPDRRVNVTVNKLPDGTREIVEEDLR